MENKKTFPFSVSSFLQGLGAAGVILLLLTGWMWLRAEDTQERLQERLPSKTVLIERKSAPEHPVSPPSQDEEEISQEEPSHESTPQGRPDTALAPAPLPGLYESGAEGRLPIARLEDGVTPFEAYKRPFERVMERPLIAVAFADAGLSKDLTGKISTHFPPEVTLILNPYAKGLNAWGDKARLDGHEIWLSLPMENETYPNPDPGPRTLLINASLPQNQERLFETLSSVVGYAGIVTQKDHRFTAESAGTPSLLEQIFGRGLGFANANTHLPFFGAKTAKENGSPFVQTDLWIERGFRPQEIEAALAQTERMALQNGSAALFIEPSPLTLDMAKDWLEALEEKSLQLAPLSALAGIKL